MDHFTRNSQVNTQWSDGLICAKEKLTCLAYLKTSRNSSNNRTNNPLANMVNPSDRTLLKALRACLFDLPPTIRQRGKDRCGDLRWEGWYLQSLLDKSYKVLWDQKHRELCSILWMWLDREQGGIKISNSNNWPYRRRCQAQLLVKEEHSIRHCSPKKLRLSATICRLMGVLYPKWHIN